MRVYVCLPEFICTRCVQMPHRTEKSITSLELGLRGGCEPSCGCGESQFSPAQSSEPSDPFYELETVLN